MREKKAWFILYFYQSRMDFVLFPKIGDYAIDPDLVNEQLDFCPAGTQHKSRIQQIRALLPSILLSKHRNPTKTGSRDLRDREPGGELAETDVQTGLQTSAGALTSSVLKEDPRKDTLSPRTKFFKKWEDFPLPLLSPEPGKHPRGNADTNKRNKDNWSEKYGKNSLEIFRSNPETWASQEQHKRRETESIVSVKSDTLFQDFKIVPVQHIGLREGSLDVVDVLNGADSTSTRPNLSLYHVVAQLHPQAVFRPGPADYTRLDTPAAYTRLDTPADQVVLNTS